MALSFDVLGPIVVRDRDRVIPIGARMQRALLAALLLEPGRAVSRDRLIEALWADEPPAAAQGALYVYVSNLRRMLEPDRAPREPPTVLASHAPGYALRIDPSAVDAERFTALIAAGRADLAAGQPVEAARALREALALWRGDPYADLAFEPFLQGEIARLQELRTGAEEALAEATLAAGEHAAIVADLERQTRDSPIRERRWELLALSLYRSGRQAEALRVLRHARDVLAEELGIVPGAALRRLEQDILDQAPSLDWHPPVAGRASTERPPVPTRADAGAPVTGPPLVGRDAELAELRAALDDAVAGRGRVALISGEPGIGKSRLAEELAAEAAACRALVAWGRAPEGDTGPAYSPWVQILRALAAAAPPADVRHALASDAEELARLVPDVAAIAGAEVAAAPGPLSEAARARLYDAVVGFVLRLAGSRPVVVIVDDLHWADPPSLQLVQLLAQRLRSSPAVLVVTYREHDAGLSAPVVATLAELARAPGLLRVRPGGLNEADIGALLAHATGRDAEPAVAGAIRARTEGNPFFVSELIHLFRASGEAPASSEIPLGVRDVVRQRLLRLPDGSRALLAAAAVVGRTFDLDVVAAATGLDEDLALDGIESALALGVVAEDGAAVGAYRFSHSIVRETVYEGLSAVRRARLHRAAGLALVKAGAGGDGDERASEIADHLFAAATATNWEDAYQWAIRAADRATRVLAFEHAEALLARAVELAGRHRSPEAALSRELAARRRIAGVLLMKHWYAAPEVGAAWSRAVDVCRRVGQSLDVLPCLWGAWSYRYVRGDTERALALAGDLLDRAQRSGDLVFDVVGNHCAGIVRIHRGELREGVELLARVAARVGEVADQFSTGTVFEPDLRVAHRLFTGLAECLTAGLPGCESLEVAVADTRRLGRPLSTVAALFLAALGHLLHGNRDRAAELSADGLAVSEEHGFRLFAAMAGILRGAAVADPTAARDALAAYDSTGSRLLLPVFWGLLGDAERACGRGPQALACVDRALAAAASTGERMWEPELHRLRGTLLDEVAGRRADAEAAFRTGLALAREQGASSLEERLAGCLARLQPA